MTTHYIEASAGQRTDLYTIRAAHPSMSIPDGADLSGLGYEPIVPADRPSLAPGEACTPGPLVRDGSVWRETWTVLPPPEPAKVVADKTEMLWQAADRYTTGYISGVAIGILTIGVLSGGPKALAVSAWSASIWTEFYRRKSLVTVGSADDHDFSSFGPMPHSVPELQAEAGM